MAEEGGGEEQFEVESSKSEKVEVVKEGVASIALLPSGSISGHFIQLPHSICYGLHGTELACERECSRGEDYRLIKLTIVDFNSGKEQAVVVECKGHDAARFHNVDQAHGWEKDIVGMVEEKHGKKKIHVSFECETLKADKAAEDHIKQFMPKLAGLDAVVNIGRMSISGLDFEAEDAGVKQTMIQ
ncbi:hypothetical protein Peur_026655 [Populus x canadensis]|uniref:uncharacterized protein LOC133671281 isoform X1 n=1 Tax=Populus nigra TaxID=3691 RepID=UPI002212FD34|nr:uncharacterized protein LOC133671281 isoform X1 [Populus nigra]KAI5558940.1 hypothetical protein BDE02_17G075600 [Populus trichocarpa]